MHHGDGAGSARPYSDMAYCAMHRRKRLRADVMPWEEQPGRMRCKPSKECRARESSEAMVTCSIHGRRRSAYQMHEVRQGVWECTANAPCRAYRGGNITGRYDDVGPAMSSMTGGFAPFASSVATAGPRGRLAGYRGGPEYGEPGAAHGRDRYEAGSAALWAPTANSSNVAAAGAQAEVDPRGPYERRGRSRGATAEGVYRDPGYAAERKVWCARHGKQVPIRYCELLQDCCYVCRDPDLCLSVPLDAAPEVLAKGCVELLCGRHGTLRSAGFVELEANRLGYRCDPAHPCRGTTLAEMNERTLRSVKVEEEGEVVEGPYGGGVGEETVAETFVVPAGQEAVSSFFV